MGEFTITKRQAAYLLEVDERTLTRWQERADDPMPVKARGKRGQPNLYDPRELLRWKVRQELGRLTVDDDGQVIDYEKERARLTKEQADNTALRNAQLRRSLAPIAALEWALGRAGAQISAILDAIPLKVKRRVPKLTASEVEIIKREITKAQNMAARVVVDLDEYSADTRADGGDSQSA